MTGQALSRLPTASCPVCPVWSATMPATTGSPQPRPHSALAYYLARPASLWIIALYRRPRPSCEPA